MPDTPPIVDSDSADPKDIANTIFAIDQFFRCMNELPIPMKYHDCVVACAAVLQGNKVELAKKLPPDMLKNLQDGGILAKANGNA